MVSFHWQIVTVLLFSFLTWMPFVLFTYLIAVIRTSSTVLNNSGQSEPVCLVPDPKGTVYSLNIEYDITCEFVINLSCPLLC